jgi:SAM-dependent methyltransferase
LPDDTEQNAAVNARDFSHVDAAAEPERFIVLLEEVELLPWLQGMRLDSFERLGLGPGQRMIEVGCGPGTAVRMLRERGIDASRATIEHARRSVPEAEFCQALAAELPLLDRSQDGYRAERVYEHVHDPPKALREAKRVPGPGGRIVLLDRDYDLLAVDSQQPALAGRMRQALAETVAYPLVGRRFLSLPLDAGFRDVRVTVTTHVLTDLAAAQPLLSTAARAGDEAGKVGGEEARAWLREQRERAARGARGALCVIVPMFLASAVA